MTYRHVQELVQKNFNSCLLSIEKWSKLTWNNPKDIYFIKAEGNLKFIFSIPLKKFSWKSLKKKMKADISNVATASHVMPV